MSFRRLLRTLRKLRDAHEASKKKGCSGHQFAGALHSRLMGVEKGHEVCLACGFIATDEQVKLYRAAVATHGGGT